MCLLFPGRGRGLGHAPGTATADGRMYGVYPRLLQMKATSCSAWHCSQRTRRKPCPSPLLATLSSRPCAAVPTDRVRQARELGHQISI
jgi:hypothetical protein